MAQTGDVVTVRFQGATGLKTRPAVVVSSALYHEERPGIILGILTSNIQAAIASTDYMLQDWSSAGLQKSSAFRSYFGMAMPSAVRVIGKLSARDWDEVAKCVEKAFA